ncbi:UDP-N-acetylglucosamine 2-epimerase (non-hydrolyzing) [Salinisphaera sp. W335]|uniref:UDP-N-acetylglucosamine 2-epimerase (Non-hydrolyzing) n=1 Tax=Spectribacter hydrogenoxidans TaxID=3075608 RepID=A0ABU3C4A0_9GAMM|nr:UDP-N-acetylglucosamine 2-epimerase (non-hydrolyzing) [Salinisphaera sp. W335]MDT0636360.1 UDP-N-acetylglucosamine 2-epimerase (non-hydrolyzing) [Salinisphaera sp. W335]
MAPPAVSLNIHSGTHGAMTGRMLGAVEQVMLDERLDAVLIYGDTNSTLAGALAAAKLHIPVAHVEAGLRSHNRRTPEEVNRILADRISHWLFTPTQLATDNLLAEDASAEQIHQVRDVMYDVALHHGAHAKQRSHVLETVGLGRGAYGLVTIHRAENADAPERLANIVDGLCMVAEGLDFVWPVHQRTLLALEKAGPLKTLQERLTLIDPVGYLDMVALEQDAAVIVTDSGGVQKEAYFHGVPCVTVRDETEWVELVDAGWNRLAPPHDAQSVADAIASARGVWGWPVAPYGDGKSASRLRDRLVQGAIQ